MKRIVPVIAGTLLLAACGDEQPKKVEIRPVRVTSIRHMPSGETISLTGQIQAKDQANLAFRIGGRLQERNVTVGDLVTPGQIVAKIESQEIYDACSIRSSRAATEDRASAGRIGTGQTAERKGQSRLHRT
jgi:multidrug efflux pump subunit AcrA (membrane-fusion protein)